MRRLISPLSFIYYLKQKLIDPLIEEGPGEAAFALFIGTLLYFIFCMFVISGIIALIAKSDWTGIKIGLFCLIPVGVLDLIIIIRGIKKWSRILYNRVTDDFLDWRKREAERIRPPDEDKK